MNNNNNYSREYPSLYRGIVESTDDPKNLGRCKVRVPAVHGELSYPIDLLPWARPLVLSPINSTRGSVNLPDVGDIVWVMFEGSRKDYPIYLGGTYSKNDIPIIPNKVVFYQDEGNSISYDRIDKSYTIQAGENRLVVSNSGVTIESSTNITLNAPTIKLDCDALEGGVLCK